MAMRISTQALYILYKLKTAGYTSFLVGGAVRDLLAENMGIYQRETRLGVADYDLTTVARPEEIQAVFPESFYENTFGTVSVAPVHLTEQMSADGISLNSDFRRSTNIVRNDRININDIEKLHNSLELPKYPQAEKAPPNFEITTFRNGESYENDARHPSSFSWGETIEEDLARRDFTVNGLALDIKGEWLATIFTEQNQLPEVLEVPSENYTVIDKYNGLTDLENNLIRTIGEPTVRFGEDALRLMRAVRLSVQLNFAIEENTYRAIAENHTLISKISFERISGELMKMLASDFPKEAILILDDTGLLKYILPELEAMKAVAQSGHHLTDVWQHSLDALASCPSRDPLVRLATLLHDVGKPQTRAGRENAYTFYNHEIVGARAAKQIGRRLRLSSHDLNRLFILVRFHMFHYQPQNTDASIRRFMRNVGLENLNDILDVREADRLGSSARKTSWRLEEMKQRMIEQLHQPLAVRDLAINGYDLMQEFNLQPGKILGEINNYLLELVLDDAQLNEREKLLAKTREWLDNRAAV
jgi:putative nucleotidyltransferase with HDIG domain